MSGKNEKQIVRPDDVNRDNSGTSDHRKKTLGEIQVEAFDHDVVVNERTQLFSAELLRLALLGLGGIGYVFTKIPDSSRKVFAGTNQAKGLILASSVAFGLSAGAALALRYLTSVLLAHQLRIVRLHARNSSGDVSRARVEEQTRDRRLKNLRPLLLLSSICLCLGAAGFVLYLFLVLNA